MITAATFCPWALQRIDLRQHRAHHLALAPPLRLVPDEGGDLADERKVGIQPLRDRIGDGDQAAQELDRIQREPLSDRQELRAETRKAVAQAVVAAQEDVQRIHRVSVAQSSQKANGGIRGARRQSDERVPEQGTQWCPYTAPFSLVPLGAVGRRRGHGVPHVLQTPDVGAAGEQDHGRHRHREEAAPRRSRSARNGIGDLRCHPCRTRVTIHTDSFRVCFHRRGLARYTAIETSGDRCDAPSASSMNRTSRSSRAHLRIDSGIPIFRARGSICSPWKVLSRAAIAPVSPRDSRPGRPAVRPNGSLKSSRTSTNLRCDQAEWLAWRLEQLAVHPGRGVLFIRIRWPAGTTQIRPSSTASKR